MECLTGVSSRDPFAETESPYVSLPSHDEAVARLVFAIETAQRRAVLAAPGGLGKTAVLRKARQGAASIRGVEFISVSCPRDGTLLFTLLAERLGPTCWPRAQPARGLAVHSNGRFAWHRFRVNRSS